MHKSWVDMTEEEWKEKKKQVKEIQDRQYKTKGGNTNE